MADSTRDTALIGNRWATEAATILRIDTRAILTRIAVSYDTANAPVREVLRVVVITAMKGEKASHLHENNNNDLNVRAAVAHHLLNTDREDLAITAQAHLPTTTANCKVASTSKPLRKKRRKMAVVSNLRLKST
jgi:hypothetical protein